MKQTKVLIIGGGPAGMACALQLHRFQVDVVLCEKERLGGLLNNANLVENYLGFPQGISGNDLVTLFSIHMKNYHVPILKTKIKNLSFKQNVFTAETETGSIQSERCVIASGTQPIRLTDGIINDSLKNIVQYDLKGIDKYSKNKQIIVIGSGDAAFDYSLQLSKNHQVTLVNRSNGIKCLPILSQRLKELQNIKYFENLTLEKVLLIENKSHAVFRNICTHQIKTLPMDFLIAAIGRIPQLNFLNRSIEKQMQSLKDTNKLYLIGDVHQGRFRQCSISIGDGIETAMKIHTVQDEKE